MLPQTFSPNYSLLYSRPPPWKYYVVIELQTSELLVEPQQTHIDLLGLVFIHILWENVFTRSECATVWQHFDKFLATIWQFNDFWQLLIIYAFCCKRLKCCKWRLSNIVKILCIFCQNIAKNYISKSCKVIKNCQQVLSKRREKSQVVKKLPFLCM